MLSISYNRQYYAFDWLHGELGGRGLYWCPSDVFLLLLVITWITDATHRRQAIVPGASSAAWLLPLLCISVFSALLSQEPVGSATEVVRLLKLALVLMYLRYNLDRAAAWTIVAALAAVILVQTSLGVMQAALGTGAQGITTIATTIADSGIVDEFAHRASGTLGHPNFLAPYLLLFVPGFAAIALGSRLKYISLLAAAITLSGLLAITLTQSRTPIAFAGLALALVTCFLVARHIISPLRALALAIAACAVIATTGLLFADRIAQRLADFDQSLELRREYNRAAIEMWETAPFAGVGPKNFGLNIGRYPLHLKNYKAVLADSSDVNNLQAVAPVHNVYLLVLSEFGLLGLVAFCLFLCRAFYLSGGSARWKLGCQVCSRLESAAVSSPC